MSEDTQAFEPSGGRPANRAGDLIDARYDLQQPVGGGVMATVWRAHDRVLGRDVAVKLWNDDSTEALQSQQDELAAARLVSPNLNEVLDAGRHHGQPYFVSELRGPADELHLTPGAPHAPEPSALPEPTPPVGQPAVGRRKTDRTVGIVVTTLALAVVLVAFGMLRPARDQDSGASAEAAVAIVPSAAASFDPEGDGAENPGEVGAVLDGDPATAWTTDRYNSRRFGNLKPGVGLIVTLSAPGPVERVELHTAEGGWSADVYGAAGPAEALVGWGQPIAQVSEAQRSEDFDLQGRTVGAVLIWFTDLGPRTNRLTVTEVRLAGSA